VGANAVVVKDVPADCVVVGVPGQVRGAPAKQRPVDVWSDPALYI
jgi:serine acetyltransferase